MFSKVMYKKSVESRQKIDSVSKPPRDAVTAHSKSPHRAQIKGAEVVSVKRPSSGAGGPSKKSKKALDAPLPLPLPTPNRTHFHLRITKNTQPEVALQFIQGCCLIEDRENFDKEDDLDLLNQWALDQSKAYARLGAITARARHGFIRPETALEIESLKKENAKLCGELSRYEQVVRQLKEDQVFKKVEAEKARKELETEIARLTVELEKVQQECTSRVDEARAEGEKVGFNNFVKSTAGLDLLQRVRAETKRAFIRSEEFCHVLVDAAQFYFNFGLDAMGRWLEIQGFTSANQFDREPVLCDAPDAPGLQMNEEDSRINALGIEAFVTHVMFSSTETNQSLLDQPENTCRG